MIFFDADKKHDKPKIIVKKKDYSLAVDRNKIKRWVREVFSKRSSKMGYVVVVRKGFLQKGFKFIFNTLNSALDVVENNKPND